jgi:hypothetical protein
MTPCYLEFLIPEEERLARLSAVVAALRADKQADTLRADEDWLEWFDDRALAHFATEFREDDPRWDFESMMDAWRNGEYQIVGIRRDGDRARLELEPEAWPYGGIDSLRALIEAFDGRVIEIDDGSQPPYRV